MAELKPVVCVGPESVYSNWISCCHTGGWK